MVFQLQAGQPRVENAIGYRLVGRARRRAGAANPAVRVVRKTRRLLRMHRPLRGDYMRGPLPTVSLARSVLLFVINSRTMLLAMSRLVLVVIAVLLAARSGTLAQDYSQWFKVTTIADGVRRIEER